MHKHRFLTESLHIFVLVGFALAQPFYDLLAKNPEFFVARHSPPAEIKVLILILSVLAPLLVLAFESALCLFGRRIRRPLRGFLVGLLVGSIFLPVLKRADFLPDPAMVGLAILLGIVGGVAYLGLPLVKRFLTLLSPAIFIFPALFAFAAPIHSLMFAKPAPERHVTGLTQGADAPQRFPPIIMVVFDEFPLASLMDETGQINALRYPNFAALAAHAYWFRNATTVADHTLAAMPAILTGTYPRAGLLATATDHPDNLFTWLDKTYELNVTESVTQLCPDHLCPTRDEKYGYPERFRRLVADLSVVYLHYLLPEEFTRDLPLVSHAWKDFGRQSESVVDAKMLHKRAMEKAQQDRHQQFKDFVASIHNQADPSFSFFHSMLPHVPYDYMPSGKIYGVGSGLEGMKKVRWSNDRHAVRRSYKRHLLQVQFVDTLVGWLVDQLKRVDLYDRSMIIILSDHGVSFRANDARRPITHTNFQDIVSVPLIMKLPHQNDGVVSDQNVELIDVVPTIADVLSVEIPWSVDGKSALGPSMPARQGKIVYHKHAREKLTIPATDVATKRDATVRRKLALFGSAKEPYGLFRSGIYKELIGRPLEELNIAGGSGVVVELDQQRFFDLIEADDMFVPAHITGRVLWGDGENAPTALGIGVNGVLWAVGELFDYQPSEAKLSVVVPEEAFHPGKNHIAPLLVGRDSAGNTRFTQTKSVAEATQRYALKTEAGNNSTALIAPNGTSISLVPEALEGWLDQVRIQENVVLFAGWAADSDRSKAAKTVLIFVDGEFFFAGHPNTSRRDVAMANNTGPTQRVGFNYYFPATLLDNGANPKIRVFAISHRGVASELQYRKEYQWPVN